MAYRLCLLVLIFVVKMSSCYLNFYLTPNEVQKLLGIPFELYYVREGNINSYALNFVVLIPPKIDSLNFNWESLVSHKLKYSIKVESSNPKAMPTPKLNISTTGVIPSNLQSFRMDVPCSGLLEAEVDLTITLNVSVSQDNLTSIVFRRKKICIQFEKSDSNDVTVDSLPHISNSANIFYVALCCAVVLIAVLAILVVLYSIRNNKSRRDVDNTNGAQTTSTTFLAALPRNSANASSYESFRRMPSYSLVDERSKDLQERISELTIQRCRVRLNSVILEGTFGRVYEGAYTNEEGVEESVIVKTATDHASQVQIALLLQEGMAMYSLNHKNILSILRVSIEDHTAPFLLYPHENFQNLKIFLQKCKASSEVQHTLTTQEVVDMALQVILAMQYLHKKHILHKDLAARNCVVDENLKIKIADNALSRDLFPSDYHCLGDNENRPVKWLAIESLLHKSFSPVSDVWSFGVLLWEFTTLAQQPYIEIDPFEMAAYLKDGYRLSQPVNCPDELFAVMAYCWAMSAEERPSFTQLHVCLQEFYAQLTRYV